MLSQMENQNIILRKKIAQLEAEIHQSHKQLSDSKAICNFGSQKKQIIQNDQKTCHSEVQYSPIHTCESLQEESSSLDLHPKIPQNQPNRKTQTEIQQNPTKYQEQRMRDVVKFQFEEDVQEQRNLTSSGILKQDGRMENKLKQSTQSLSQVYLHQNKQNYNSAIRDKALCQDCIIKMHQMHEIQFLKNNYHKEYISIRTELEKLRAQTNDQQFHQTPRSSINLIDIYGDHNNEQKSEKSSFSFQNIQNTLLSERFSLQIEQFIKIIDRLMPLDSKSIELSCGDFNLLFQLEVKLERLKSHLGLDTQPKYLEQLFNELQKSEKSIKKIHDRYKKLFEKVAKAYKQKNKRNKDQFNWISQSFVILLKDFNTVKDKNAKLASELQTLKAQPTNNVGESKEPRNSKDILSKEDPSYKQHHECLSLERSLSDTRSDKKTDKDMEKAQLRLKTSDKIIKKLQKTVKQLQAQVVYIRKKSQNDLNQFMNTIIPHSQSHSKLRNTTQQTESPFESCTGPTSSQNQTNLVQVKRKSLKQGNQSIQQIGALVYEIFSFTSCQNDEENVFLPESKQQTIQMLTHIKKFAQKFDEWQKIKQREIDQFQKNFLHLLKFFIDNFKVSEEDLVEEISKMKDSEPLLIYIKKYYSKAALLGRASPRVSSTFTFGPKSQSYKDSQNQP